MGSGSQLKLFLSSIPAQLPHRPNSLPMGQTWAPAQSKVVPRTLAPKTLS